MPMQCSMTPPPHPLWLVKCHIASKHRLSNFVPLLYSYDILLMNNFLSAKQEQPSVHVYIGALSRPTSANAIQKNRRRNRIRYLNLSSSRGNGLMPSYLYPTQRQNGPKLPAAVAVLPHITIRLSYPVDCWPG